MIELLRDLRAGQQDIIALLRRIAAPDRGRAETPALLAENPGIARQADRRRTARPNGPTEPAASASHDRKPGAVEGEIEGEVKWYNVDKGFGFIVPDDGSSDIMVHVSMLKRAGRQMLVAGERVTCAVAQGSKGRQAVSLTTRDG